MGTDHNHRVCTYGEAESAIRGQEVLYVNDCFCRGPAREGKTKWEYCGHPVEVCMGLRRPPEDSPHPFREIPQEEALRLFEDWKRQRNFFRFMENEVWICFCCGCGCGWFRDEEGNRRADPCDKSSYVEQTDLEKCTGCRECVPVCSFGARQASNGTVRVETDLCYGCEACVQVCEAISMVPR